MPWDVEKTDLNSLSTSWDTWMAQLVAHPTSAQVMISRSVGWSPASGSVLTAQSLEPASDSVSPSVCPSLLDLSLSLSLKNKQTLEKKKLFQLEDLLQPHWLIHCVPTA